MTFSTRGVENWEWDISLIQYIVMSISYVLDTVLSNTKINMLQSLLGPFVIHQRREMEEGGA